MKSSRRWRATRCRRCPLRPGFPAADFRDCGPSVFAYGRTQADADAAADKLVALIESHEDDFDGRIYSPDDGVRHAMELAKNASKPIVIADTQDNPGAGGNSDTTGMLRALVRNKATRRHRRDLRSGVGQGRACRRRRRHRDAVARRQVRHPGRRAVSGNLRRRKTVGRQVRGVRSLLSAAATWRWAVGVPAHRRRPRGREFLQGAARRPGDVPLCRHRADRTGDPGQQEFGAFPRRLRADRRKTADLRRARRDAGRYRHPALDAAASGHPHQAERPCLSASAQSRSTSPVTG